MDRNNNDIKMYSTHNEGESAVAEIFIKSLTKQDLWIYNLNVKMYISIN